MLNSIKLNAKQMKAAKPLINAAFPQYTGRKVWLTVSDREMNLISCWDGGCREQYVLVELATGRLLEVPANGSGYEKIKVPPYSPKAGVVVVQLSWSGWDKSVVIFMHPEDAKIQALAVAA